MSTPRFIRPLLRLLLMTCLGALASVQAAPANTAAGSAAAAYLPGTATATPADAVVSLAQAGPTQTTGTSAGRILFVLASSTVHGSSTLPASISFGEVVEAWDIFQAAGYAVDFVSPEGGAVPILDAYVSKDMEPRRKDDRIMNGLRNTAKPAQVDPARYRAVYYVGGSNAIYGVPGHPVLQAIAMQVYERQGGVVSAVCHGTAGIVNLKLADGSHLVAGKRITGYPEEHEDQKADYFKQFPFLIRKTVESRGGLFHAVDGNTPYVEVDGRVVTGQNYLSAKPVAQAVVEILRKLADQSPGRDAAKG